MKQISKVKFYFENNEIDSEIIKDSFTYTQIYYNKLSASDGSIQLKLPFDIELSDLLKSTINQKVKVELFDSSNAVIDTGYVQQNVTFEKTQKNKPISLTIVSPSFYLDSTLPRNIACTNKSVDYVIKAVLKEVGIEGEDYIGNTGITNVLPFFTASEGDSVKKIIGELCYEYGKVYYFDSLGKFQVRDLFNDLPSNTSEIIQELDGSNLRESIKIQAIEHDADYVSGTFNTVSNYSDTLVFSDTQNATEKDKCKIEVQSGYWMFESSDEKAEREESGTDSPKINYLDYDSTLGKVLFVDGITPDVSFDSGLDYTISDTDTDGNLLIDQCMLQAKNTTSKTLYCRKLDIYAKSAYIATSTDTVVSSTGTKVKEIELDYIYDKTTAENFVKNLANYYRYANFTITAKSFADYDLGSFVKVTEYGIGTFYGRIIQKKQTIQSDCIEYTIETITDYEPAKIEKTTSTRNSINAVIAVKGEKGDPGSDGSSFFVYLEQSSVTFNVDDEGKVEAKTVKIPIHVVCDNLELPFKLGTLEQPDGLTVIEYEDDNSHGIQITTTEDYLLGNGTINVPIIYTQVTHAYVYGDTSKGHAIGNGSGDRSTYGQFLLDETSIADYNLVLNYSTARLSIYKNAMSSITGFLDPNNATNLHLGDWFTWVGENNTTETYNGTKVTFKKGTVYKWNGYYWEEDDNLEHLAAALSDVLSCGKAMVEENNAQMVTLLENLTENEAFLERLNNDALTTLLAQNTKLQDKLAEQTNFNDKLNNVYLAELLAKNATLGRNLAKAKDFYETLDANTDFTDLLATNTALIKKLVANETYTRALVADETFTNALSANEAFIETLAASETLTNKLVANETFTDTLCANEAFTDKLTTTEAYVTSLASSETFTDTLCANTVYTDKLATTEAYTEALVANTTFTEELASNTAFIEKLVATEGFIDKLVANEAFIEALTAKYATIAALTSGTITVAKASSAGSASTAGSATRATTASSATQATTSKNAVGGDLFGMNTGSGTQVAIHSDDWENTSSTTGFGILRNGDAYFNNGFFRGEIQATSGSFSGTLDCGGLQVKETTITSGIKTLSKGEYSGTNNEVLLYFYGLFGRTYYSDYSKMSSYEGTKAITELYNDPYAKCYVGGTEVVSLTLKYNYEKNTLGNMTYYNVSNFVRGTTSSGGTIEIYTSASASATLIYDYLVQHEQTGLMLDLSNLSKLKPNESGIAWNNNGVLSIS